MRRSLMGLLVLGLTFSILSGCASRLPPAPLPICPPLHASAPPRPTFVLPPKQPDGTYTLTQADVEAIVNGIEDLREWGIVLKAEIDAYNSVYTPEKAP